ncbi:MAG: aspartate carbamoyltransferase catalytic subunit [Fimbriimonadales bacterium]
MHLLSIREMVAADIQRLLVSSARLKKVCLAGKPLPQFPGKVIGMLFFENSTRTRVSFEMAAGRLGFSHTSFGVMGSSMSKGESLKDTVLTLKHEGVDGLVMRHESSGAPYVASRFFGGPVINAGDGMHEHPTQALADALTIIEHKGKPDGLQVAIVGDIQHSRVARSNLWLLSKLGAEVRLVGPRTLIPRYPGHLPASIHYDLYSGIENADVVMALRLQSERMSGGLVSSIGEYASMYQINNLALRFAKPDCLLMHPGPVNRGLELDDAVADGKHSVINEQVANGVFVRMAVLETAFNGAAKVPARKKASAKA